MTGGSGDVTGTPTAKPALAVHLVGVNKSFNVQGGGETVALQGIDLDVRHGEFVSLIGPSGCGKSTLLRIVGDLIQPSSGSVDVNGKAAHRARLDRDYGMVFQAPVLFDWRSVEANVRLPLEVMRIDSAERDRRQTRGLILALGRAGGVLDERDPAEPVPVEDERPRIVAAEQLHALPRQPDEGVWRDERERDPSLDGRKTRHLLLAARLARVRLSIERDRLRARRRRAGEVRDGDGTERDVGDGQRERRR
jgi:ABC-type uncharacterized transport system YnjBCD ATPase subunit